jgi:excisionase family DNA binding protein
VVKRCSRASRPRVSDWRSWVTGQASPLLIVWLLDRFELIRHLFGATNRFPTGSAGSCTSGDLRRGATKPNALRLICSELLLDHLRVPTGYPSAPYWWLLRAVDLSSSTPSQRHFSRVSNNRQLAPFRPLKAVARVRIPSGLPVKPPLTRPDTTTSRRASRRVARQGRARDARTPTCAALARSRSADSLANKHRARVAAELCCRGLDRAWDRNATCNDAPRRSSVITGRRATRYVGDRQAGAIRLKGQGTSTETSRSLATSGPFTFSHNRRKEMTNELDRLMTITDLSEMLGVPVDTLYGWRHRGEGPEGYRIGRHVRYRRAAVEAWLDAQADRQQRSRGAH